jgi:UTP--glucose-1-phosphate uridylyltransferase
MAPDALVQAEAKLRQDGAAPALVDSFRRSMERLLAGETGLIPEEAIEPVPTLPRLDDLADRAADGEAALPRTLVLKLNGGLGTGMGLDRAKSLLPVKDGLSFLDIIARQILHLRQRHEAPLPVLFMNSFSTERDTLAALAAYPTLAGPAALPLSFQQHRVPKLRADTHAPVQWPADPEKEWCPPGHGDLYTALVTSGLLRRLLAAGFRYAFVSNADNLGATLDLAVLGYFAKQAAPFLMEVTARTEADRKGGHLARRKGGGLLLRESAQCPSDEMERFQDIRRHRYFNTNNLWLNLEALDAHLRRTGGTPDLPVIINRKTVDPRDPTSPAVVQLETAMGAALSVFEGALALDVPRTRFAPVKTTDDLLALWSDAFVLTEDFRLVLHADRHGTPPNVRLDPRFFRLWPDFQDRFPAGAPSLLHCQALAVAGDVSFGRNIILRGRVELRNEGMKPVQVSDREWGGPEPTLLKLG